MIRPCGKIQWNATFLLLIAFFCFGAIQWCALPSKALPIAGEVFSVQGQHGFSHSAKTSRRQQ